jgi:hypothetical protein
LTGKTCAQSEQAISILAVQARQIRGDDANGLTQRIAWLGGDGKRFVVRVDEKLTAFLELEAAILSNKHGRWSRKNKARQMGADHVQGSSITSSDVSTHLRPG